MSIIILLALYASAGINPDTCKVVAKVLKQNQMVQKEDRVTRLARSVISKLETDESNVSKVKILIMQPQKSV